MTNELQNAWSLQIFNLGSKYSILNAMFPLREILEEGSCGRFTLQVLQACNILSESMQK